MKTKEKNIYKCLNCDKIMIAEDTPKECPNCESKSIVFYDNYIMIK